MPANDFCETASARTPTGAMPLSGQAFVIDNNSHNNCTATTEKRARGQGESDDFVDAVQEHARPQKRQRRQGPARAGRVASDDIPVGVTQEDLLARAKHAATEARTAAARAAKDAAGKFRAFHVLRGALDLQEKEVKAASARFHRACATLSMAKTAQDIAWQAEDAAVRRTWKREEGTTRSEADERWASAAKTLLNKREEHTRASRAKDAAEGHAWATVQRLEEMEGLVQQAATAFHEAYSVEYECSINAEVREKELEEAAELVEREAVSRAEREAEREAALEAEREAILKAERKALAKEFSRMHTLWSVCDVYEDLLGDSSFQQDSRSSRSTKARRTGPSGCGGRSKRARSRY